MDNSVSKLGLNCACSKIINQSVLYIFFQSNNHLSHFEMKLWVQKIEYLTFVMLSKPQYL